MGQKPSSTSGANDGIHFFRKSHHQRKLVKLGVFFSWLPRSQEFLNNNHDPNPLQPIKFQYKTRRKTNSQPTSQIIKQNTSNLENNGNTERFLSRNDERNGFIVDEKTLHNEPKKSAIIKKRTKSDPNLYSSEKLRHRRKESSRRKSTNFGYKIGDLDTFLNKASIEYPANIPVVLAFASVLYQTRVGGYQAEILLPLGMVVNAIFKNQNWLYIQTPHAEEGYVNYTSCLPLGIIPPADNFPAPCWEKNTDVFPKPSGNMTDMEKLSTKSECYGVVRKHRSRRSAQCTEQNFDHLYLQATSTATTHSLLTKSTCSKTALSKRHQRNYSVKKSETLLVAVEDYCGMGKNSVSVKCGEVLALIRLGPCKDQFWIRTKDGVEGYIPASVAGHGFF